MPSAADSSVEPSSVEVPSLVAPVRSWVSTTLHTMAARVVRGMISPAQVTSVSTLSTDLMSWDAVEELALAWLSMSSR